MTQTTRQSIINLLISAFWLILWCVILYFLFWLNTDKFYQIPLLTWDVRIIKPLRDISLTPIQNVENVMSGGISWVDYITQIPIKHPNISWNSAQNTEIIHKYLYNKENRLIFNIPEWKNWLLLITTLKPIAKNRELFLWLQWSTVWILHKEKWIVTNNDNEYLFDINKLPVGTWPHWISLFDNTIDGKVQLNVFAAETDNYVEKITMIFY